MIKSMTGFGRCEKVTQEYKISVEMKGVNHRYLDLSITERWLWSTWNILKRWRRNLGFQTM